MRQVPWNEFYRKEHHRVAPSGRRYPHITCQTFSFPGGPAPVEEYVQQHLDQAKRKLMRFKLKESEAWICKDNVWGPIVVTGFGSLHEELSYARQSRFFFGGFSDPILCDEKVDKEAWRQAAEKILRTARIRFSFASTDYGEEMIEFRSLREYGRYQRTYKSRINQLSGQGSDPCL